MKYYTECGVFYEVSLLQWDKLGEGTRDILITKNGVVFVSRIKPKN